jgi:hypothetical protein
MQGEGSSLDLEYNNQRLQPGNWLNDTIMANYASLLAGFDTMGIHLLLINPEIVAFIASASLTAGQKELSRVHRWKQGYLKKKVSKQLLITTSQNIWLYQQQSVWPQHWFFIIAEPLQKLETITSSQHGTHWTVAHADLPARMVTYSSSLNDGSAFSKWSKVLLFHMIEFITLLKQTPGFQMVHEYIYSR